jgi:mannose-6-phosphate isomerase
MLGEAHLRQHGTELALLCKLLDSAMRLPLQVHPTATFARKFLASPFGKTECWIVIETRIIDNENPYVLFGFKSGVTDKEFERVTAAQATVAQIDMLHRIPVRPGDAYLVPAGTPHAIGPGVFLLEVQEPTDLTISVEYSFAGSIRSPEQCFLGLGCERAMRCFDYTANGTEFIRRCALHTRVIDEGRDGVVEELVGAANTPCFEVLRLRVRGAQTWRRDARACVAIVIEGKGRLLWQDGEHPLHPGDSFFLPAYCDELTLHHTADQPLTVLACLPPRTHS